MLKRLIPIVGLFLLAGCGSSAEDACENIKDACKDDTEISKAFNMGNCVDYFEKHDDDERDCVADAESCEDIIDCDSDYFVD